MAHKKRNIYHPSSKSFNQVIVMKKLFKIALLLATASVLLPVQAKASIVRTIESRDVSGEDAKRQTVKVWPGHGVSISFYGSDEIIKKIWLDDPSKFIVDVDGCLQGMECRDENEGAGLIHVRRINNIKIRGLPQSSIYGAHLTVITESTSGKKVYHFSLISGNGKPEYSQLKIVSSYNSRVSEQPLPQLQTVNYSAVNDSKYIEKGMQVAVSKNQLKVNSPLWDRLIKVVSLRSQGRDIRLAAYEAKVSMRLINKLMNMGVRASSYTTKVRKKPIY